MDGFNAHILSDEASAGSVVVGTGISATLLLFFQQSFERMLPYLVIAAVVEAKTGANIEGAATKEEYAAVLSQRRAWRGEINEAEAGVAALDAEVPEDEDAVSAEATEGRP